VNECPEGVPWVTRKPHVAGIPPRLPSPVQPVIAAAGDVFRCSATARAGLFPGTNDGTPVGLSDFANGRTGPAAAHGGQSGEDVPAFRSRGCNKKAAYWRNPA